jgi:3-methyladenine DNA glycosylase Tag
MHDEQKLFEFLVLGACGWACRGQTIVYAHKQDTGTVNDHTVDCFRQ